uniref:Uncharacterized protein n=1 Tax=Anguilla anguilla TaxID=7936 RepID=A0A0E9XUV4_ANGAN
MVFLVKNVLLVKFRKTSEISISSGGFKYTIFRENIAYLITFSSSVLNLYTQ